MAKQQPKLTRKDKIADGKKPEVKTKKVVTVKEKGPVPASYAPNNAHKVEAERQAFAKKIADARPKAFGLVRGESTVYLIGETRDNQTEGHYLEVFQKEIPATEQKEGFSLQMIRGDYPEDNPVVIPHAWLFKSIESLEHNHKFARGEFGEIQRSMLEFLQRVLKEEIAEEKYRRNKEAEAAKKAATLENKNHGTVLFSLATSDGVPVEQQGALKLSSLSNFGPKQYNLYNFPTEGNRSCVVAYTVEEGVDMLRIHSMHTEHQLAKAGVKVGLMMCAKHLNKTCAIPAPDYDQSTEVYTHLCLFRGFLLKTLDQVEQKKQRKAA